MPVSGFGVLHILWREFEGFHILWTQYMDTVYVFAEERFVSWGIVLEIKRFFVLDTV